MATSSIRLNNQEVIQKYKTKELNQQQLGSYFTSKFDIRSAPVLSLSNQCFSEFAQTAECANRCRFEIENRGSFIRCFISLSKSSQDKKARCYNECNFTWNSMKNPFLSVMCSFLFFYRKLSFYRKMCILSGISESCSFAPHMSHIMAYIWTVKKGDPMRMWGIFGSIQRGFAV